MKENWKDVLGYEGLYQASNLGRIRSLNYNREGKIKILKPVKAKNGYLRVNLYKDGKLKHYSVHRLVWEAFNGKIPEGYEINHINEIKTDNRLENLNLMTPKQNVNWGTRNQRVGEKQRNDSNRSKPVLQFTLEWKFVREWPSTKECGRNGFNQGHVAECCRGELKTYKGYKWMYADDFFRMLPEI